jgi:2-polyprenyl-3-methyl-5-hydroxy-6-metoxy-1,4-benzoquinol methylase
MAPLTLTGERTLPGIVAENYWYRRHEAAYRLVASHCVAATVLEAGCGEGYGAELLRQAGACRILALDYDPDVVGYVRRRYPALMLIRANVVHLPCRDETVDVVVALQVIEHLWEQPRFVDECARVLRPGGTLAVTTPNRLTFATPHAAGNPFHSRELSAEELMELVTPAFHGSLRGLGHAERLRRWEAAHGSLVDLQLAAGWPSMPSAAREQVARIAAEDFEVHNDTQGALDLLFVGIRR